MNRFPNVSLLFMAVILALPLSSARAESAHDHNHAAVDTASPSASTEANDRYTNGEIRKVDLAQAKLTIRHGDIKSLGMPGMTMNFKLQNPALLSTVQVGDQVQFVVERQTGGLVITELKKITGK